MRLQPIDSSSSDAYFAQAGGGGGTATHHEASVGQSHQFDDVFGSAPASPSAPETQNDSHPSDVPRLQTEHTTAGYREGITVAKESSIQAGFDEGFSLGAALGAQAGQLLGMVEGIADALKARTAGTAEETTAEASTRLLREARDDLCTDNIFSAQYWAPDGNWRYDVVAAHQDGDRAIVFSDVADAHPVIRKWRDIVDEQLRAWRIQTSVLDNEDGPRLDAAVVAEPPNLSAALRANQTLDW
ncbi:hypothetical protein E4U42_000180 [Claviceps africana]|uniref:Protein YAE1 n=1 Tax=Claviceps africana TaxID=83212 RepID=A0A8K0NEB1_9HYPO|nr:hypothetical protein E4U42_000180 [Claviceps africana]